MEKIEKSEDEKVKRHTLIIYIIALLTLFIAIIGATFAYFAARIIGNEEASSVLIRSSSLTIEYLTQNEINVANISPGFKKDLDFTVSNNSTGTAGYKLYWVVGKNEFINDDLVYSVSGTTTGTDDTLVSVNNKPIPKVSGEIGTGVITANSTQTYKLNVEFLNRNANQNDNQNKAFAGKIEVRSN